MPCPLGDSMLDSAGEWFANSPRLCREGVVQLELSWFVRYNMVRNECMKCKAEKLRVSLHDHTSF